MSQIPALPCLALVLFAVSGCVPAESGPSGNTAKVQNSKLIKLDSATATLYDTKGANSVGTAYLDQYPERTQFRLAITLPAGTYGMHLHSTGKCEGPDFASAGPHWNPMAKQHGFDNPMGSHGGDLPNLEVSGKGGDAILINLGPISLSELIDADGASIIIHAKPDDYKTDPSGNSGGRMICGVFQRKP